MSNKKLTQIYGLIRKHNQASGAAKELANGYFSGFEGKKLLDALTGLQASMVVMATSEQGHAAEQSFRLEIPFGSLMERVRRIEKITESAVLKQAAALVLSWPNDLEMELYNYLPMNQLDALRAVQTFFQEAMGRDGTYATPSDISELMWITAGSPKHLDVYSFGGVGLYLGLLTTGAGLIDLKLSKAKSSFNRGVQDLLEESFTDLLLATIAQRSKHSDALLINAASNSTPIAGEGGGRSYMDLNHLVGSSEYQVKAMLVPNTMLSAGHGPYKCIPVFRKLVETGLDTIREFQNVLSRRDEKFSILVFQPPKAFPSVTFDVLNPEQLNVSEINKFGIIRRPQALKRGFSKLLCAPYMESETPAIGPLLDEKDKRNKSYEPGRIIQSAAVLPSPLVAIQLEKICEGESVHRFQHIEQDPTETYRAYVEIGAADIDAYGQIDIDAPDREKRYYDKDEEDSVKRNSLDIGDVVLCVKGSIGKTALIERLPSSKNDLMVANQSFVRLRLSQKARQEGMTPQILFWWLRSEFAQKYLKSKTVAAGVPRIPIADILLMPVPKGPASVLAAQAKAYAMWKDRINQVLSAAKQASAIQSSSWR